MRKTSAGRLNNNPGLCIAPIFVAEAAEVEVVGATDFVMGRVI